jgi:arabinose-5-phosphate isomerase
MNQLINMGKDVLVKEANAILQVMEGLDETFGLMVEAIEACEGRVVLTGIGKSGLIAKKISSTLSSIGIPSLYLHPADSLHGDLGMVQKSDIFFIVSNSGESEEIVKILPWMKRMGIYTLVISGNNQSTIARYGDLVITVKVDEACPYNIVPTSSTTAMLALGDALAITLMRKRDFQREDFALLHPGGALGRRLILRVEDLMHTGESIPRVYEDMLMKDVIYEVSSKRLGLAGVFNREDELLGIITDGDLRRALERYDNMLERQAKDVMVGNPKGIEREALAAHALKTMEQYAITSLFVYEESDGKRPIGIIHIHDLLRAKIV